MCCRRWAPTIAPIGVMVAKIVGTEEALLSLICRSPSRSSSGIRVNWTISNSAGRPMTDQMQFIVENGALAKALVYLNGIVRTVPRSRF